MTNITLRLKVQGLREKGCTYSEIKKIVKRNIPKSTLSVWCNSVPLTKEQMERIIILNKVNLEKGRKLALVKIKEKQTQIFNKLSHKNMHLLKKLNIGVQKLILSILYLAEGAKNNNCRQLMFGNSDPKIISFYLKLLKNCYNIEERKLRGRIQCRYDQDITTLERFWQKLTGIGPDSFYPTYKDMRTKGKMTLKNNYKGVCTINYFDRKIQIELITLANNILGHINKGL